jgi:collagenase-like PrtC family protease
MKFAIGYQHSEDGEPFSAIVSDYRDHLGEVYFAWSGRASGRPPLGHALDESPEEIQQVLEEELQTLRRMGVKLDLLFNANCYGERAVSVSLEKEVLASVDHLGALGCCPEVVTTTSLMIARTIKRHFPAIEVRASVNMRIGTTQAMGYVADLFDSFYLQRDLQRNIDCVKKIRAWCDRHGKKLCLLANSGCLRFCPGQTFHDNLIAHCAHAEQRVNLPDWNPHVCWNLYGNPDHFVEILRSTWIRPEDIGRYDGIIDTVKLATRQHAHPRMVVGAYASGRFDGNLLDLLEPGFAPAFAPYVIGNAAFPSDWSERVGQCVGECDSCAYCQQVLDRVLKKVPTAGAQGPAFASTEAPRSTRSTRRR